MTIEEPTYVITMNCNRIELDAWIDQRKRPDGGYDLIGMGRRREYDATTGALVADKTEPTGLKGFAPCDAIEPPRPSWWGRLYRALARSVVILAQKGLV